MKSGAEQVAALLEVRPELEGRPELDELVSLIDRRPTPTDWPTPRTTWPEFHAAIVQAERDSRRLSALLARLGFDLEE